MLSVADRQVGLFDAAPLCRGLLGEDSFYALLAEHGDRIVRDEDFAACLLGGRRAPLDPALAAGQGAVAAGRLGRRAGQPEPDRDRPARPGRMIRVAADDPSPNGPHSRLNRPSPRTGFSVVS
jgi:hypothetical protein